jgi:Holliday junction resolvasome RuvABC endonuclease subunit
LTDDDKCVLAIDPGTTTGLAVVRFDGGNLGAPSAIWSDQLDWDAACERISYWLERLREMRDHQDVTVAAVGEMFQINANTARRGQQGCDDALGMLGVAQYICRLTGVEFAPRQHASAAKKLVTDDALRAMRLYGPGLVHANDASRHAALLAVKRHWMEPIFLVRSEAEA